MSGMPRFTRPLCAALALSWGLVDAPGLSLAAAPEAWPGPPSARSTTSDSAVRGLRLGTTRRRGSGYVADLEGGATAELTLDAHLQETAGEIFDHFRIPYGAAVVVSIPDGRVLALAGRSAVSPELGPEALSLQAWAPAASIFKLVSATALVADAGLDAASRTCYHGGVSALRLDNLVDNPRMDRSCGSLGYGIGKSKNAILAKLAVEHLKPEQLAGMGRAFAFGETIAFELPIEPSHLDVPADDQLEFARTAAGFWHSTLSAMHGALLAATIANRGEMPVPRLIDRIVGVDGRGHEPPPSPATRTVMAPSVARQVGQMMELTTEMGTARAAFHDRRGHPLLSVAVAGKTGTLSATTDKGQLEYSWFVGYAPTERPQIAFAVVLGNPTSWRIKATYVGRRLVEEYSRIERVSRLASKFAPATKVGRTIARTSSPGGASRPACPAGTDAKLLTASRSLTGALHSSD
jgi:peptidoglycan glycosyltransferase